MSTRMQIMMIIAVLFYFGILINLLRKNKLSLKYTLLWIFSGFLMFVVALFPRLLDWFALLVGIYEPTNALFAVISFCLIIILMSITAIVSKSNNQIKRLTQTIALLEKKVRDLEEKK